MEIRFLRNSPWKKELRKMKPSAKQGWIRKHFFSWHLPKPLIPALNSSSVTQESCIEEKVLLSVQKSLISTHPCLGACTCLRGSLDLFRFHWKGFQTLYCYEQPTCALQTSIKKEEERMSRFIPIHLNSPQHNYIKPQILLLPIKRRGQDCSVHFYI